MSGNVERTAVVCTHNRCKYLPLALESLANQTLDSSRYEILAVDNASTDDTYPYLLEQAESIPNFRCIQEPRKGLSIARNSGWEEAKGRYVAFLDDDAIAYPNWLENALAAFSSTDPEPACLGGPVEAIWCAQRPDWVTDKLVDFFTVLDWGEAQVLGEQRHVAGANIIYSKDCLAKMGGFPTQLGRKGKLLLSAEETLLNRRLRRRGFLVYYDPEVKVRHHIPASRLTKSWVRKRLFWGGVSQKVMNRILKLEGLPAIPVETPPRELKDDTPQSFLFFERLGERFGKWLWWYWTLIGATEKFRLDSGLGAFSE